jgi:hypothetical protein
MRRRRWVPILGVDDEGAGARRPGDLAVRRRDDPLAALDVEAPIRIGEVVLHVDHDQGRLLVVPRELTHGLLPSWTALSVRSIGTHLARPCDGR